MCETQQQATRRERILQPSQVYGVVQERIGCPPGTRIVSPVACIDITRGYNVIFLCVTIGVSDEYRLSISMVSIVGTDNC